MMMLYTLLLLSSRAPAFSPPLRVQRAPQLQVPTAPRARPAPIADAGGARRPPPAKRRKPSAAPRRANPSLLSFAEEDEDGL